LWATEIAFRPADHYLASLRLRLSDLLAKLGEALFDVWSRDHKLQVTGRDWSDGQERALREDFATPKQKALDFLLRYEDSALPTKAQAQRIWTMIAGSEREAKSDASVPEIVRFFYLAALDVKPDNNQRLAILSSLGVLECSCGLVERQAGRGDGVCRHFAQAKDYFGRIVTEGERLRKSAVGLTSVQTKMALVWAKINLANTELELHRHSEASLHEAIALDYEARRLVAELGLSELDFTYLFSNLLLYNLELAFAHKVKEGYSQAWQLARAVCEDPKLGPAFLKTCLIESSDPELIELLEKPEVTDLRDYLHQQAEQWRNQKSEL
jgi:hypothetical protein